MLNILMAGNTLGMVSRLATLILIVSLQTQRYSVYGHSKLTLSGHQEKAFYGNILEKINGTTMEHCLERCLENCMCMSFQVCHKTQCHLCSVNKQLEQKAPRERKGCLHYDFKSEDETKASGQQCHSSCMSVIDCCKTSNPCLNGGTCLPPSSKYNASRYRCQCPDGFGGHRCHKCATGYTGPRCQQRIRSCKGYKETNHSSGKYYVFDADMKLFQVYCDFDKNSSMVWTLIQSHQLQFNPEFKRSFTRNRPVNPNIPSWDQYRLTKPRMASIQQDSSKWRITCNYESSGTVYRDYVRVSNAQVNILTFNGHSCVEVEYIDIRGYHCNNCTAYMVQSHNRRYYRYIVPLHFDSYYSGRESCDLNPAEGLYCRGKGEDNFGLYDCPNEKHRCSATGNATTQIWFGGE